MTIIVWLEATTTQGTVTKGCSVKKMGGHRCNGIHHMRVRTQGRASAEASTPGP